MILAREAKRSDPLGRYYTDSIVGRHLVEAMDVSCPKTVIDLGAGSGILVQEASRIWTGSKFLTVDIDKKAQSAKFPDLHGSKFKHHVVDALDFFLAEKMGLKWAQADAAVCNPPYLLPRWRKHFGEILEDAGLSEFVPKTGDISADLLFIAQNLRMLKTKGKLGLILPDGIIAGEKYAPLRKNLIEMHCIEKVIELPRRAFKHTDAKAHILVMSKNCESREFIPITRLNNDGSLSKEIFLPTENFHKRLDYSYVKGSKKYVGNKKLGDVAEDIFRGQISSSERSLYKFPIFHTTDFPESNGVIQNKFYLSPSNLLKFKGKLAQKGDILLARVGRNLSNKICVVEKDGCIPISDCVMVLRVKELWRSKVLRFLKSDRGRVCIETGSKGVGARFITASSLGEIKFS